MEPKISVIICTHNPRRDYIERVLKALKSQTLDFKKWELLVIDNASSTQLSSEMDLYWHPKARHIREDNLGLTFARLRGILEAKANLLIFVDDDNILGENYLEQALSILDAHPFIGAFGGSVIAETEVPIKEWQKPYLCFLAVREVSKSVWGNISFHDQNFPYGAGLCIRSDVARKYYELAHKDPLRVKLGRKGNLLSSAEDRDLVFSAYDCGYATGLFPSLQLTHLIPNHRLEVDYLLRLRREGGASGFILDYIRHKTLPRNKPNLISCLVSEARLLKKTSLERKMIRAGESARKSALKEIYELHKQ